MTTQFRKYLIFLGLFLIIFMVAVFADQSIADMYKWVDENGIVHFSETLPDDADNSDIDSLPTYTTPENSGYPQDNNSSENENSDNSLNPADTVQKKPRAKTPKVELYTTSWCPWCKKAKAFFRSRGIAFVEYDIEKDKEAASRKAQLDRQQGVPFAVINGIGVSGYNIKAYNNALSQ
jgi:glutaredoxin